MKPSYKALRKIALILSDEVDNRLALPVALELDERLSAAGVESRVFDLADQSYPLDGLVDYEAYIFISGDSRPGYPPEVYHVLIPYMELWAARHIGVVRVANTQSEAEMADRYMNQLLKHAGIGRLSRLVVLESRKKFDNRFNLTNSTLDNLIGLFLEEFIPNIQERKIPEERRLIA